MSAEVRRELIASCVELGLAASSPMLMCLTLRYPTAAAARAFVRAFRSFQGWGLCPEELAGALARHVETVEDGLAAAELGWNMSRRSRAPLTVDQLDVLLDHHLSVDGVSGGGSPYFHKVRVSRASELPSP